MPLSFHEEDPSLLAGAGINEGEVSRKLGVPGACAVAEDVLVARDCMLALATGARVVIQHISSAASVEMVRAAKAMGADVHAEATPHHFALTEDAVLEHGTLAKMNPPLRTEADRKAILEGLRDGTVDIVATDHAPHTAEEKAKPLTEAPSGIIGLETSLALGSTYLVQTGVLTLPRLLEKMTANPARCYRLPAGSLRVDGPADLVLFDENEKWTVGEFASKASNSPFAGQELTGKVKYAICRGEIVYRDGQ
jgi:dihydroorotase